MDDSLMHYVNTAFNSEAFQQAQKELLNRLQTHYGHAQVPKQVAWNPVGFLDPHGVPRNPLRTVPIYGGFEATFLDSDPKQNRHVYVRINLSGYHLNQYTILIFEGRERKCGREPWCR